MVRRRRKFASGGCVVRIESHHLKVVENVIREEVVMMVLVFVRLCMCL